MATEHDSLALFVSVWWDIPEYTSTHRDLGDILGWWSPMLSDEVRESKTQVTGLVKKFSLFCKIKDEFFIFTNNFFDLDLLSMFAISCVV